MKGNNTLVLNEATMRAALECYFRTLFAPGKAPEVLSVKWGEHALGFKVELSEPFPEPTPAN